MPHSNETSTAALSRPGSGLSLSVLGLLFLINFFIAHGCIDGINWNENENTVNILNSLISGSVKGFLLELFQAFSSQCQKTIQISLIYLIVI